MLAAVTIIVVVAAATVVVDAAAAAVVEIDVVVTSDDVVVGMHSSSTAAVSSESLFVCRQRCHHFRHRMVRRDVLHWVLVDDHVFVVLVRVGRRLQVGGGANARMLLLGLLHVVMVVVVCSNRVRRGELVVLLW